MITCTLVLTHPNEHVDAPQAIYIDGELRFSDTKRLGIEVKKKMIRQINMMPNSKLDAHKYYIKDFDGHFPQKLEEIKEFQEL